MGRVRCTIGSMTAALLLMLLPGCKPEGCDCIPEQSSGSWGEAPAGPSCGEQLCPTIVARGGDPSVDGYEFELDTPDAVECALTALRDRTPGIITYDWDYDFGQFTNSGYIFIEADGTAVFRSWGNGDLSFDVGKAVLQELQPAEFYAQCLADPSAEAQLDCVLTRGSAIETCANGWSVDYDE